jgi:hypothetical protein
MFFKVLLILFFINFSLCEEESQNEVQRGFQRTNQDRIVNGEIIDIESVPYYVSIMTPSALNNCGGSIISNKWILSAAHCHVSLNKKVFQFCNKIFHLKDEDPNPLMYKVRSGTSRTARGGVISDVVNILIHPLWVRAIFQADFALLNLKRALTFNARTQPIKLPSDTSYSVPAGEKVLISGHGDTENPLHSTELLKGILVKTISFAACKELISWLTDTVICIDNLSNGEENKPKSPCSVCIKN